MSRVRVTTSRASDWGEGPVWWGGRVWYVDIEGCLLICFDPESGLERTWEMGQRIGFALPADNGQWIVGGDRGLFTFDPESGQLVLITDPEADMPENRFNDAAVSPDGRLFAGTIATDKTEGAAALYRLEEDRTTTTVIPGVTNSNGLAWSPDGGCVYYIDTPTRLIRRYRYAEGMLSEPTTFVDTDSIVDASPDGCCMDAAGHLWVAFCHGGCVIRFHGHTGAVIERIEVPAKETTSCCFGGATLCDLYITTGKGEGPRQSDGRLYVVPDLETPGIAQVPVHA